MHCKLTENAVSRFRHRESLLPDEDIGTLQDGKIINATYETTDQGTRERSRRYEENRQTAHTETSSIRLHDLNAKHSCASQRLRCRYTRDEWLVSGVVGLVGMHCGFFFLR